MARRAARLKSRTWRARRRGFPGTVLGRSHQVCFPRVVATTCWTRSGQSAVKLFFIRPYAACRRMQATRSHHVQGLCLRRRPLGCQCYEPPAQREASTLLDLQGDYGTTMLKYRCGMLHRRRACRSSGVYLRSGQMLAVPLQVSRLTCGKGSPTPTGGTCVAGSRR